MSMADHADFWSQVRLIVREEAHKASDGGSIFAEDGIIADGSYSPKDGTVSVWMTETASLLPSNTEQPLPIQGVQLLTPVHGQQAGPVGGERVILIRRHSGWLAVLEHGEEDSPGAPAGEYHYLHKSGSFYKFKNSGDLDLNANAAHNVTAASSTHAVTGNETHTAQNFSATATTAASVIAPSTQIGPSGGPYLNIGGGGYSASDAPILEAAFAIFNAWAATHIHGPGTGSDTGPPTISPPTVPGASNVSIQ